MNCIFGIVRIIHLNTYAGNGGAGRACMRLNKALNAEGMDSEVAVNFLFRDDPDVQNLSKGFFSNWFSAAGIIIEGFYSKIFTKAIPIPFSFPVWGKDISGRKLLRSADIIHLHWINHAFLRPEDLAKLSVLNKPIVWTFHDSNAFTGGCHVRYDCDHFMNECGDCPVLKDPGPADRSHKIWLRKDRAYKQLKFSIVSPSQWMAESIVRSKLLGQADIVIIPNTLDTSLFKPLGKAEAREQLGLSADKFILMSGFMPSRKDLHKGTPYLIEAIEIFIKQYQLQPDQVELVIFGNRDDKKVPAFPVRTTFMGTITEDEKLALYYSSADVFLAPSLEDNLPNTVLESLACGTPVAAFATGGIPDMVKHKHNGYLAEYRSSADLAKGIAWIYNYPNKSELNVNARKTIEDHFSEHIIAREHIKLYQSLLSKHVPS